MTLEIIFGAKLLLVGSLNLYRKGPEIFLKNHIDIYVPSKRKVQNVRELTKMVHFDFIFDVFSLLYNQSVVIHFASCQTFPGTSLEYPNPIFLR